jgi:hypothetical protein
MQRALNAKRLSPKAGGKTKGFAPVVEGRLAIPGHIKGLNLQDLPASTRLDGVMERKNLRKLGDLDGLPIHDLMVVENCGAATIAELKRLITKAAAGDFKTRTEAKVKWSAAELLLLLDALVRELPERNADVVKYRLGGTKEGILTLEAVGTKYGLTRERVRQVIDEASNRLRRLGSRRLGAFLQHVGSTCRGAVSPLTPELLADWLGRKSPRLAFPLQFYVGLMRELDPSIPGWPRGHEPATRSQGRRAVIEKALLAALPADGKPLTAAQAFTRTKSKMKDLDVVGFLDGLRRAQGVKVEFPKPDRCLVAVITR